MTMQNAATDKSLAFAALATMAKRTITAITAEDRLAKPCASVAGLMRETCVDEGDLWIGMVSSEPHTASHWHDHGERVTYVLPLEGAAAVEYGDGERMEMQTDGTLYVVPPHVHHREVNDSDVPFRAFLFRMLPRGEAKG